MAGGQSPRQKMINLMYLVFIAMLALNMSKEVLSAFGLLDDKIAQANIATTDRNTAFMESLSTKAAEQPEQYAAVKEKADRVDAISEELDNYIAGLKDQMMSTIKEEDRTDYMVQDKPDFLDQLLFKGDNLTEEGQRFLNEIDTYRNEMLAVLGDSYPDIKASITRNFSTAPVENRDGIEVDWLNYNYEGFPLIASKTKLTSLQNDIKVTKNELLSKMLAGQQASALSFTQYNTLLEQSKSAFYAGEPFDGGIVLGRKDPNTKPNRVELTLDGRPLTESQYTIENGKVVLNISAGAAGDHKIAGNLIFLQDGKEVEIPVSSSFATITKPNSAVIAADKMNVVYRGVTNPMTVSIPGIPDNKVSASGSGLSKVSGSKYVMNPGSGRTVTITASGTLPDGERVSSSSEFRIKDIPAPTGTIRGEAGMVKMNRNGLEISSVGAMLEDFDFDLDLRVTGFSFKVSGQPTVRVNGRKLDAAAQGALRRAKRGETVQIFDINTSIGGSNVKLKRTAPVIIELTN
ncbi:MAG: gliding motility protein GldM [Flavobacteriaceae bacterium]|nr:gliding motility protein GldM [Flavobacteriaceae bacterium]